MIKKEKIITEEIEAIEASNKILGKEEYERFVRSDGALFALLKKPKLMEKIAEGSRMHDDVFLGELSVPQIIAILLRYPELAPDANVMEFWRRFSEEQIWSLAIKSANIMEVAYEYDARPPSDVWINLFVAHSDNIAFVRKAWVNEFLTGKDIAYMLLRKPELLSAAERHSCIRLDREDQMPLLLKNPCWILSPIIRPELLMGDDWHRLLMKGDADVMNMANAFKAGHLMSKRQMLDVLKQYDDKLFEGLFY